MWLFVFQMRKNQPSRPSVLFQNHPLRYEKLVFTILIVTKCISCIHVSFEHVPVDFGMVENAGCGMRDTGCGIRGAGSVENAYMEAYTNKARVCLKIAHS